ncbi:MAG TPA: hypothetical protein VII66_12620, partial [Gemmatimonadaceae bacterium]
MPPTAVELSPAAKAALTAATAALSPRMALLDSIVAVYRLGPAPDIVTTTAGGPVSNADRHAAIAVRLNALHELLQRAGFKAVYRDARYHECTFVRSTEPDSTDIGYLYAPQGCQLANSTGDGVLRIEHAQSAWYSYASPERRRY